MADVDRLKSALFGIIERLMRRVDFHAMYSSRVVTQNANGTLDLQPDDARMPGMQGVPMRLGIPGVVVKVKKGSRVLLGFENGDPKRPVATVWEVSSLEEIKVTASVKATVVAPKIELGGEGGRDVARKGDMVMIGGFATPPTSAPNPLTTNCVIMFAAGGPIIPGTPYPALIKFGPLPLAGSVATGSKVTGSK